MSPTTCAPATRSTRRRGRAASVSLPGSRPAHAPRGAVRRHLRPPAGRGTASRGRPHGLRRARAPHALDLPRGDHAGAGRLTYTQVRQALEDKDPHPAPSAPCSSRSSTRKRPLARLLIARRAKRSAIDFRPARSRGAAQLRPTGADRARRALDREPADREFMLSANGRSRELARRKLPSLHRVHEPPAPDKLSELTRFLEGFGLRLKARPRQGRAGGVRAVLEAGRRSPGGEARQLDHPPHHATGALCRRAPPATSASRPTCLHALHLTHPRYGPDRPSHPRGRAPRRSPHAAGPAGDRRGIVAPRARQRWRRA